MAVATGPDIEYVRGDLVPIAIDFKRDGSPFNWAGYTDIEITVNPDSEPTDNSGQIVQLAGTPRAVDGSDGTVDFAMPSQAASDALVPGEYFYDIQAINGSGQRVTLALGGKFTVKQDINKD